VGLDFRAAGGPAKRERSVVIGLFFVSSKRPSLLLIYCETYGQTRKSNAHERFNIELEHANSAEKGVAIHSFHHHWFVIILVLI